MSNPLVRFFALLTVALVAGTLFGIWLGFDPAGLSPGTYVESQQRTIRALGTLMPALGGAGILLTIVLAVGERGRRPVFGLLVAVAVLLLVAGLVTVFQNQPINAQVMTWRAQAPPANWSELRDQWWLWHVVRSVAGLGALGLLIGATLADRKRAP